MSERRGCATVPFAKNRQRHGRKCGGGGATDRAFCKKSSKARSKMWSRGRDRPCLLQKNAKGTVETAGRRAQPTVPFVKKRQRHGRNGGAEGATDRAFWKKTPKARSKLQSMGRGRPCLLEKNVKGTVETAGRRAQPTVPFAKNGQNWRLECAADRAFCKKTGKGTVNCLRRPRMAPPASIRSRLRRP